MFVVDFGECRSSEMFIQRETIGLYLFVLIDYIH